MSMPSPSSHRPPKTPGRQPQTGPSTPPKQNSPTPNSQNSVLERLKAARPKASTPEGVPGEADVKQAASRPDTARQSVDPDAAPGDSVAHPPAESDGTLPAPPAGLGATPETSDERADKLRHSRIAKLKTASAAASTAAAAWAVKSGKQTAVWTASASRGAAKNVRSWRADVVRQVLVTLLVPAALAATAWAAGLFGGREIWNATVLAPDLTLVSPSRYSLYLWALIALGMIGYVVHQWLPHERDSPRHRRLGWAVIASLLVNLGLALAVSADLYVFALVLHGVLLAVLFVALYWLNRWSAATWLEGALVDVPLGLFLGWTGFTALSSTAAVLSLNDVSWLMDNEFIWAMIGLGVVVLVGSAVCSMDRGRIAVALALVWGLGWVIAERIIGQPASMPTAAAAALAAFLVLITAGSRRHHVDHSYRRALRRRQTANLPPIDLTDDDDDDEYDDGYDEDPRNR